MEKIYTCGHCKKNFPDSKIIRLGVGGNFCSSCFKYGKKKYAAEIEELRKKIDSYDRDILVSHILGYVRDFEEGEREEFFITKDFEASLQAKKLNQTSKAIQLKSAYEKKLTACRIYFRDLTPESKQIYDLACKEYEIALQEYIKPKKVNLKNNVSIFEVV